MEETKVSVKGKVVIRWFAEAEDQIDCDVSEPTWSETVQDSEEDIEAAVGRLERFIEKVK